MENFRFIVFPPFLYFLLTFTFNIKFGNIEKEIISSLIFSSLIFSAIIVLVLLIPLAIICRKWEAIKFWMFIQFGFQFKDKNEVVEKIEQMDYDAFVNYT